MCNIHFIAQSNMYNVHTQSPSKAKTSHWGVTISVNVMLMGTGNE